MTGGVVRDKCCWKGVILLSGVGSKYLLTKAVSYS